MSDSINAREAAGTVNDPRNVTQHEVEQFLYNDAALLDAYRYEDWLATLTDDARYEVPAIDRPEGDPRHVLAIVADDNFRLHARVKQLIAGQVLGENPRSRTRRMITNVRIMDVQGETLSVSSNFAIYRFNRGVMDVYVGSHDHTLVVQERRLKIKRRRAVLDLDAIRPHGKLTIIL